MNRIKQDGVWLSPEENKAFMEKRFKKEHGIELNAPAPEIEQTFVEAPVVEESTNGSEVQETPEDAPEAPVAPVEATEEETPEEEEEEDDIEELRAAYEKKTGKNLSPRFKNDPEWIKKNLI